MLDALGPPALAVDADERVVAANPPAKALLGIGATGAHFSRALRNPALVEAVERTLGEGPLPGLLRWRPPGTQDVHEIGLGRLGEGAGRMAILLFNDRTGEEKAEAMRRDFVANVSHELRTPLTTMMGFIETLQGPARDDPEARERFLDIMAQEAERMKRLVEDLLSLSRVEEMERQRPVDPVDLVALAESVLKGLAPQAAEAGVTLHNVEGPEALSVPGDADQLRQVLTNLVENAIKYAGQGAELRVTLSPPTTDPVLRGPAVALTVADTGAGIDPLHIPRLTERFYRADDHRAREKGGTGLGLAIVKHIVSRHRGRLRIESRPGEGCRVTVLLPTELRTGPTGAGLS